MSLSFNEFNRELQKRNIDPQVAFMLATVFERLTDLAQQQMEVAKLCETLADAVMKTAAMQKADQEHLQGLIRIVKGSAPGISVTTEPISNEPV